MFDKTVSKIKKYFTVSVLTGIIRNRLITPDLQQIWVLGEITDLKYFIKGKHAYFSLKEGDSLINCAFFAGNNRFYNGKLENGMKVFAFGSIDVYAPRGNYQLIVRQIVPAGEGEFALKIKALEEKLKKEGLFDRKRPVPELPETIGLITSKDGAAVKDFLKIVKEIPYLKVILYPALVQGEDAPATIIEGIKHLNRIKEVEVIVITRGGGSEEDLRCFFDEQLVRAIYNSEKPTISAIGHERDVVFTDRVADLRKATPTEAGKFFADAYKKTVQHFKKLYDSLDKRMSLWIERSPEAEKIKSLASKLFFFSESLLNSKLQRIDYLKESLERGMEANLTDKQEKLNTLFIKIHPKTLLSDFETKVERLFNLELVLKNSMEKKIEKNRERVSNLKNSLKSASEICLNDKFFRFKELSARIDKRHIVAEIEKREAELYRLKELLRNNANGVLNQKETFVSMFSEKLNDLSPLNTVARGYAIVRDKDGTVVKSVSQISPGDRVNLNLKDGSADCNVIKIEKKER